MGPVGAAGVLPASSKVTARDSEVVIAFQPSSLSGSPSL